MEETMPLRRQQKTTLAEPPAEPVSVEEPEAEEPTGEGAVVNVEGAVVDVQGAEGAEAQVETVEPKGDGVVFDEPTPDPAYVAAMNGETVSFEVG